MFAQESDGYLDRFFAEHDYPNISWIHQLNKENYALTSETLLDQADSAPELSSKQVWSLKLRNVMRNCLVRLSLVDA